MIKRREFLQSASATAAALAIGGPALAPPPEPAWVAELRHRIEAIPDDGWDRTFWPGGRSIQHKTIAVDVPGEFAPADIMRATGCVNPEGFAGRRAGTVMFNGADWDRERGTRLWFMVRRGVRWDERPDPETGRLVRVTAHGKPLYPTFDFASL